MIMLGPYQLNGRALLARVVYRWSWIALLALLALLSLGLLRGGLARLTNGSGTLEIVAPAGATVLQGGLGGSLAQSGVVTAGSYTVSAFLPDGRHSWQTVTVAAGTTVTATLDPGLAELRSRAILPAGPGAQLGALRWANGAWRVPSFTPDRGAETDAAPSGAAPRYRVETSALTAEATTALATLNAFNGLADEVTVAGQPQSASYRAPLGYGTVGALEISAGGSEAATVPISSTLRWMQWAPDGGALLWAEQATASSEQLRLWTPRAPVVAVVAVPGQVEAVRWQAAGAAALVVSNDGRQVALTLVRLRPAVDSRVVAVLPIAVAADQPTAGAGLRVPLSWSDTRVLWIAPDGAGTTRLFSAALADALPTVGSPMETLALHVERDGTLRLAQVAGDGVVIARQRADGTILGLGWVPNVSAATVTSGQWAMDGASLVLQGGAQGWLVTAADWRSAGGRDG